MEYDDDAVGGFDTQSAAMMREIGLSEECAGLEPPAGQVAGGVRFTRSAALDWEFLRGSRIIGAPIQLDAVLDEGLAVMTEGKMPRREMEAVGSDGAMWHHRGLRWVIRFVGGYRSIVVHGIAQARLNSFRKIWRYFDQEKAIDLLQTSELYLCRVDRLNDEFEARPTEAMRRERAEALRRVFGEGWQEDTHWYENIRRALYVTCFQKLEAESADMWRDYCPNQGGLAIQVTERALQHEVARLRNQYPQLFFRDIDYIDHGTYDAASHGVPEQAFLKRQKFEHEREIRLARFMPEVFCGTQEEIERCLSSFPDHYRLPFDLNTAVATVVINPACSAVNRAALEMALKKRRRLCAQVRESTVGAQLLGLKTKYV